MKSRSTGSFLRRFSCRFDDAKLALRLISRRFRRVEQSGDGVGSWNFRPQGDRLRVEQGAWDAPAPRRWPKPAANSSSTAAARTNSRRRRKQIREQTGVVVDEVVGDLNDPATRAALVAACPEADILVNNNGGPPFKAFGAITREDILAGVEANMLTPIALVQALLAREWRSAGSAGSSTSPRGRCARRSPGSTSRPAPGPA